MEKGFCLKGIGIGDRTDTGMEMGRTGVSQKVQRLLHRDAQEWQGIGQRPSYTPKLYSRYGTWSNIK